MAPVAELTMAPSVGGQPTAQGNSTAEPSMAPVTEPTAEPSMAPVTEPTAEPSMAPAAEPTAEPSVTGGGGDAGDYKELLAIHNRKR